MIVTVLSLFVLFSTCMQCDILNSSKIDCGKVGTTKSKCLSDQCCWSAVPGQPWCFYPRGAENCFFVQRRDPNPPFNSTEIELMKSYFLKNINIGGGGGVVASPDKTTPGGSYYFHWERDGALSMRALMMISSSQEYLSYMKSYVQNWVLHVQHENDPHGQDVRVEPKYLLPNGSVFPVSWCRPQTDGPALRATTLIIFANELIKSGQTDYVKEYLWTSDPSVHSGGLIKYDLDWVYQNWEKTGGCDLWEELNDVHSDFFWNRYQFKRALMMGASFARTAGDEKSADLYQSAGIDVNSTLMNYWNGQYIFENNNRKKDAAVIVAFNDGYYEEDDLFSPTSEYVAGTIQTLNELFCLSYPINRIDSAANVPGVLYGRYEGDIYAGGNPWFLTTGGLAELFYRGAVESMKNGLPTSKKALTIWSKILGDDTNNKNKIDFAQAMSDAGDSVLRRIRYHAEGNQFHLTEQLDKNSGYEMAAKDLTWSYATVLKANYFRGVALEMIENAKKK